MRKKTFVVSDESINTYGFRVLTDGLTFPLHVPAFDDHDTESDPIGHWDNFRVENGRMLADFNYNDVTVRGKEIGDMVEAGHLGQASIGIDLRYSKANKQNMVDGQKGPTFYKTFAPEISIVKLASNRSAIALYDDGISNRLNLSDSDSDPLSKYDFFNDNNKSSEMKKLTRKFNLADDATEDMVLGAVVDLELKLSATEAQLKQLKDAQAAQKKAEVKTLLDTAVTEKRIAETERPAYEQLFDANFEAAKTVLAARTANVVKLSDIPKTSGVGSEAPQYMGKTWLQLQRENPTTLKTLKAENPSLFKAMYKADLGVEYVD